MTRVRNHWGPRDGWRQGRHKYACLLTCQEQPDLLDLVRRYQDALGEVEILDLVEAEWLHVTMLSIAFVDEVAATELAQLTARLRERLAKLPAPTVTFHRPTVVSDAVYLPADPPEALDEVRLVMNDAVARSLPLGTFRPHVSVAYVNSDGLAEPISASLQRVEPAPVTVRFPAENLVRLSRDDQRWDWSDPEPLPFQG